MDTASVFRHVRFVVTLTLATATLMLPCRARPADSQFVPPDCGLNSLYILLRLSGDSVDLALLRRTLPPQTERGYSLLELRDAASACGYPCSGISLGPGSLPPDRPAIAFMGDTTHGHFVVLRPIEGTDRSRIQVLDPPYPPLFVEWDLLSSDPHWTGRVLVRQSAEEAILLYLVAPGPLLFGRLLAFPKIRAGVVRTGRVIFSACRRRP